MKFDAEKNYIIQLTFEEAKIVKNALYYIVEDINNETQNIISSWDEAELLGYTINELYDFLANEIPM